MHTPAYQRRSPAARRAFYIFALAALLLPLTGASTAVAQNDDAGSESLVFNLQPKPKAGQVSRYEIWTARTQFTSRTINGQASGDAQTKIEVNGEISWTINSVAADGSYEATMLFDYLSVDVTLPTGDVRSVDSRKPNPGEPLSTMHDLVSSMSTTPLDVSMTADGSVKGVRGVDRIRNAVGEENDPPTELDFIESASDLATLLEAPAAAAIGDRWTVDRTWSREIAQLDADLTTRTTYTLASVENIAGIELATVTGTSKCTLEPDMPDMSQLPANAPRPRFTATADITSAIMFDMSRNEAIGRNATENLRLQVDIQTPQANVQTVFEEVIQSQALRISEKD